MIKNTKLLVVGPEFVKKTNDRCFGAISRATTDWTFSGDWTLSIRGGGMFLIAIALGVLGSAPTLAQSPRVVAKKVISGKVMALTNHSLIATKDDNSTAEVLFQDEGVEFLTVGKSQMLARIPAKIKIRGTLTRQVLRIGLAVEVRTELAKGGIGTKSLKKMLLLPSSANDFSVKKLSDTGSSGSYPFRIRGLITHLSDKGMTLAVPRTDFSPEKRVKLLISKQIEVEVKEKTMREVVEGDMVSKLKIVEFASGEMVAKEITVDLANDHTDVHSDPSDMLMLKYRKYDSKPKRPHEIRSAHFVIKTDLSERSGKILLDKLERMFRIVSKYYGGKKPSMAISCYVVQDLKLWEGIRSEIEPGMESIVTRAGVTHAMSLGRERSAIVYSCGDHKVVQHEAVHAFCHLTFGSTGPTWYSEGMAELGCYWRPGELEVNLDPVVIRYLTSASRPSLDTIVRPGQTTGDSWQAYAWRWAFCYMLVNNKNYSKNFYDLGVGLMRKSRRANFYKAFEDSAAQITFEYEQFLEGLANGYRADLCQWNWKKRAVSFKKRRMSKAVIVGKGGWQPSTAHVVAGRRYELVAQGKWSTATTKDVSGDGDQDGIGRLIGAVLVTTKQPDQPIKKSYALGETIELGKKVVFEATETGHLFLRCAGPLAQVSKNDGKLVVYIRPKK